MYHNPLALTNCIVLYLYIYIVLLAVHTNQKRFQCERPREKREIGYHDLLALTNIRLPWLLALTSWLPSHTWQGLHPSTDVKKSMWKLMTSGALSF